MSERDAAIDAVVNAEIIAEGRDALQKLDKERRSSGGSDRGGCNNDIDNSPGGPN